MIKGILFVIFFLLLFAALGIAIFGIIKVVRSKKSSEDISEIVEAYRERARNINYSSISKEEKTNKIAALQEQMEAEIKAYKKEHPQKGKSILISGIASFIVMLGLVICIPGSFHQVETGSVAVVRHLGTIVAVREPGTYFDFYMTNAYEVYDTKVQQDKILTAAYSKDGQTMDLEVFLQYRVQTNHIKEIATQYGTLDALQSRIETQTIEKTKGVMSSAEAMTIIQNRAQFSADVSTAVREGISDDYYVDIKDVVLTNIDFTDEFEKSVEDKVIAEQEKQAAITRAEAELEVAKLEAQKKIEQARGDAEAQKILAQATAEAATYKIIELARVIGYTVNETYIYSVDGIETEYVVRQAETESCIYLGTKYVIDITTGPGADSFKSLVEDYLQYLAYLEQWDGKLPDVVAGDDAISIIVPNN